MQKSQALASLGQRGLLLPVWVKAALAANDRLKVYLSLLQAAATQAEHPEREPQDLSAELAQAGLADQTWLQELPAGATRVDGVIVITDLARLVHCLGEDLDIMARPVLESSTADAEPHLRVQHWHDWLESLQGDQLSKAQLRLLTHGKRHGDDSLHLLVMDLHKAINALASELASEDINGAHVWQLQEDDRPLVGAFMRGLHRTAPLKLDHPGLETAATRDGDRLLLQNDIGTNDAHVLVIQVRALTISLTYSDLHSTRFDFFQSLLAPLGAQWSNQESRVTAGLNQGEAYTVGTASFACTDLAQLSHTLEGIGAAIVFLIDWNRARKRLLPFVSKRAAIEVLSQAARMEVGHMAWLRSGADRLIFSAMQAMEEGAFRIGDRLTDVLGEADAIAFLVDVMRLASTTLLRGQPVARVADETRLLLARHIRRRTHEFDMLDEHAAYCHALAQAVSDALEHGHEGRRDSTQELAARAKLWERRADHLVMQARELAERQPHWVPFAHLLAQSDDVADALEEAAFLLSLIADHHQQGWHGEVRQVLSRLARTVLQASQDHVKSLAIARLLGPDSEESDHDEFLDASWAVLRAERQCDDLLRTARRCLLKHIEHAPALMLANDLALALELASDHLLATGYALRELAFTQAGVRT